jgi:endonuclease YncB( thermonuclease family)
VIPGYVWTVPSRVLRWKDGDTCEVLVDKGWRDFTDREGVRLLNLWCPELNEPGGLEAKSYAEELIPPGSVCVLHSKALAKAGLWTGSQQSLDRTLGDIRRLDGADFASLMISAGKGFRTEPELQAWLAAQ